MSRFEYHRPSGAFGMFPPVIKMLLIINISVYLFQFLFDGVIIGDYSVGYLIEEWLSLNPFNEKLRVIGGVRVMAESNFYPWQLISYQFLHGGFMHLLFNMFALWMFGIELEQMWGSNKFLTFYLLSGLGAGLLQMFISDACTVGASGSVFGILLGFALSFPERKIFMFPLFIPISAKYLVLIFAGVELISGMMNSNSGVAHFAHLGGAAAGFLLLKFGDQFKIYEVFDKIWDGLGKIINSNAPKTGYQQRQNVHSYTSQNTWRQSTPKQETKSTTSTYAKSYVVDGEEITQNKIDDILDKISASGYQNLTDKEKFILNELSKRL